jgi:hypothetical protein
MFQVQILWVLEPCSIVVGYQRFGRPCHLHVQDEEMLTSYYNIIWRLNPEDLDLKYVCNTICHLTVPSLFYKKS